MLRHRYHLAPGRWSTHGWTPPNHKQADILSAQRPLSSQRTCRQSLLSDSKQMRQFVVHVSAHPQKHMIACIPLCSPLHLASPQDRMLYRSGIQAPKKPISGHALKLLISWHARHLLHGLPPAAYKLCLHVGDTVQTAKPVSCGFNTLT